MNASVVKELPKIELHCHLDGSVCPEVLWTLAQEQGIFQDMDFANFTSRLRVPPQCRSLAEYIGCFSTALACLQTKAALYLAVQDVLRQAAEENVVYMEIRFAPALHTRGGLSLEEVVAAAAGGLAHGEKEYPVKAGLLLCMMRGREDNGKLIPIAKTFLNHGVCGIDLAGDEAAWPPELYAPLFEQARKDGIPFTIHGGECGNAQNVLTSADMGARRIGHGIALAASPVHLDQAVKRSLLLEVCPTSNVQTCAVLSIVSHPFGQLYEAGIPLCLNTDNRTISAITLTDEILNMAEAFPSFDYQSLLRTTVYALEGAFLSQEARAGLEEQIRAAYKRLTGVSQ